MKKFLFTTLLTWLLLSVALSQPRQISAELALQLEGKSKLEEIMQTVLAYYQTNEPALMQAPTTVNGQKGNPVTKWVRWALQQSNRLDDEGNLTDYVIRNYEAALQANEQHGTELPVALNSNVGSWSFIGPNNTSYGSNAQNFKGLGRVDRIAFHPTDANTVYIGTPSGGLWRTTNNGTSWVLLTRYLPSPGISGIVVNSTNPNIIYILTGDGDSNIGGGLVNLMGYVRRSVGVLRSTDGGTTWQPTGDMPGLNNQSVGYKLVQDPNNANTLIAATNNGLYRTTNSGATWTQVRTGRFWDVVYRHNSSTTVYATGDGGDRFIRSTNGGATWSTSITYSPSTPSGTGRGQLAVGVSATAVVYILWGPVTGNGSFRGIYRSADAGLNFTRQTTTPNILGRNDDGSDNNDQSTYDLGLAVRPTNSGHIFAGSLTMWRSTDAGVTMTNSTSFNEDGSAAYIHPDVHDVKYHPNSGWLYAATDGGMYRSNDNGVTWTDISPGINTTQFYRGTGFNGNANLFLGGAQDNGVLYRSGVTSNYRFILCCDGFDAAFRPDDATRGYVSMNQGVFRLNTLNGGGSGINPTVNGKWFQNLATHPSNGALLYVGADSFHRSNDGGANYQVQINVPMGWALTSCPSNTNRLYGAGGTSQWAGTGNIRRSDDQGATWTIINGTTFTATNRKVTSIGVRPNNSAHVWATIGGFTTGHKVFRTTTGNSNPPTWTNVSGTLPNVPVNCIAVDGSNNAYVGTDIGVYYRGASMTNWVPFFNFLPRVPITSLILNEGSGVIKAVTFGYGVWQSPVYSNCPANLSVTSVFGTKVYEAGTELTASGTIFGGTITEAYLKSGNRIILQPGFAALAGNNIVRAYIGPCANGIPIPGQVDNGEPTEPTQALYTNFPYGAITGTPFKNNYTLEITVPEAGNYRVVLINEAGETIATPVPAAVFESGTHRFSVMPQQYIGGFHLQLWKEEVLCDFKEW